MSEGWHGICPHCRHRLHVHGWHTEGVRITCPGCHTAFTIPALAPPMLSAPQSASGRGEARDDGSAAVVGGDLTLNFPYYALWSVERTAVVYNARTIGAHEWYAPGVRLLLDSQNANGCWKSHGISLPPVVPTSFALLFLGRADLAPELSRQLRYVEKDGRMLLVKTPDKSLPRLFYKRNLPPLESDVDVLSPGEKSKPSVGVFVARTSFEHSSSPGLER